MAYGPDAHSSPAPRGRLRGSHCRPGCSPGWPAVTTDSHTGWPVSRARFGARPTVLSWRWPSRPGTGSTLRASTPAAAPPGRRDGGGRPPRRNTFDRAGRGPVHRPRRHRLRPGRDLARDRQRHAEVPRGARYPVAPRPGPVGRHRRRVAPGLRRRDGRSNDIVSGTAGTGLALLYLDRVLDHPGRWKWPKARVVLPDDPW